MRSTSAAGSLQQCPKLGHIFYAVQLETTWAKDAADSANIVPAKPLSGTMGYGDLDGLKSTVLPPLGGSSSARFTSYGAMDFTGQPQPPCTTWQTAR